MHEFSTAYSEYNSIYAGQFDKENWFRKNSWRETTVVAVTLDDFCSRENITPCMIKIDVEGSEFDVVYGGGNLLLEMKTGFIVMEYLFDEQNNLNHKKAVKLLLSLGFFYI